MTRKRPRLIAIGLTIALSLVAGAMASYHHARVVADHFVGPLPVGIAPFRAAPIPFHLAPVAQRWSWVLAYGDQFHDGFEVYVTLFGHVVETNPRELHSRLRAIPTAGSSASRPTT